MTDVDECTCVEGRRDSCRRVHVWWVGVTVVDECTCVEGWRDSCRRVHVWWVGVTVEVCTMTMFLLFVCFADTRNIKLVCLLLCDSMVMRLCHCARNCPSPYSVVN